MKNRCRKLVCMGMAILMTLSSMPATTWAETVTPQEAVAEQPVMEDEVSGTGELSEEGFQYGALEDGTLEIIGYYGSDTSVVVPAEINGKAVTRIGDDAFASCRDLTSIELPDGLTSIGTGAFSNCSSLTSIKLPDGVTEIGVGAFAECYSLTGIQLPSGLTSIANNTFDSCNSLADIELPGGVTSIGAWAFRDCSLTGIELPDGVTSIGSGAFCGCSNLTDIKLPDKVTSIGESMFEGCSGLTGIELPGGVTEIGWGAFAGCISLTSIELPSGVTSIGGGAFVSCISLQSIDIPDGVTKIDSNTFMGCNNLTSIKIPDGVESIESCAFLDCSSLTGIELPDGLTEIGYNAFRESGLTSITIPAAVTSIKFAFEGCDRLTNISVDEANADYSSLDGVLFDKGQTKLIYYPGGKTGSYQVPVGVTDIEQSAFEGCSGLTDIELPVGIVSIGADAFRGCLNLLNISVDEANADYSSLDGVLFNKEKTELICCPGAKMGQYRIPDGVTKIYNGAFYACKSLTGIEIPETATDIADTIFYACDSLLNISVDEANAAYSSVDGVLFNKDKTELRWCPDGRMGQYRIPDGVTAINVNAFYGCNRLTGIEIGSEVTELQWNMFSACDNLLDISVDEANAKYSSLGGVLFDKGKTTLLYFPKGKSGRYQIPDGVTAIGRNAFDGCDRLMRVEIPSGVTDIDYNAIGMCKNLTIICEKGSSAHMYALENDIPFRFIGEILDYTITLDVNGGTALDQTCVIIEMGEALGELPAPTRSGYTFKGWFTEKTGGTAVTKDTIPTADMTIYAQWEQVKNRVIHRAAHRNSRSRNSH